MSASVKRDVVVVGGGPAGLAAAIAAREAGANSVMLLERDPELGGVLGQCIHDGFGLHRFGEDLTGPEYARLFIEEARRIGVELITSAMVTRLDASREVSYVSSNGVVHVKAGAVVLATGCRERTRGAIRVPGQRLTGVYTAGVVQQMMNKHNLLPGKRAVVLGSGDIGLIVARRLTLEGARVECVAELMPYSSGLPRNITQCLDDYDIPLLLSHTVVDVKGSKRVESVTVAEVDSTGRPIVGSEKDIECDMLVLSVGLIPECELAEEAGIELDRITGGPCVDGDMLTNVPGVFACGNGLHVHDIVDAVSDEAEVAGNNAALFAMGRLRESVGINVMAGQGIRYVLPGSLYADSDNNVSLRVSAPVRKCVIVAEQGGRILGQKKLKNAVPSVMEHIAVSDAKQNGGDIVVRIEL